MKQQGIKQQVNNPKQVSAYSIAAKKFANERVKKQKMFQSSLNDDAAEVASAIGSSDDEVAPQKQKRMSEQEAQQKLFTKQIVKPHSLQKVNSSSLVSNDYSPNLASKNASNGPLKFSIAKNQSQNSTLFPSAVVVSIDVVSMTTGGVNDAKDYQSSSTQHPAHLSLMQSQLFQKREQALGDQLSKVIKQDPSPNITSSLSTIQHSEKKNLNGELIITPPIPHTALGIRRKSVTQRGAEQVKNMISSPSIEIQNVPSNDLLYKKEPQQNPMFDTVKIGRHLQIPSTSKRNIISDLVSKHSQDASLDQSQIQNQQMMLSSQISSNNNIKIGEPNINKEEQHYLVNLSARAKKIHQMQASHLLPARQTKSSGIESYVYGSLASKNQSTQQQKDSNNPKATINIQVSTVDASR